MPTTITLTVQSSATATINVEDDNIPIDEIKHIIEIYSLIKSKKIRHSILGMIDGALLFEDNNMLEKIVELTVRDYKNG